MNGHNKYIAATAALLSALTVGASGTPVAATPSATQPTSVAVPSDVPHRPLDRAAIEEIRASQPHPIHDDVADLIVRLVGNTCTGTPIKGTNYVVTAAHCVFTETGEITQRTIVRDHLRYPAVAVLVDTAYLEHRSAENDVAVLVMAQEIPGPSARIGTSFPDVGDLTLAGFQPVDSDGTLLRGRNASDHPRPKNTSGTTQVLDYEPAACVSDASTFEVSPTVVLTPCGLIPGASGGGLYTTDENGYVLVGVLSWVTADYKVNGIVPLASLLKLLASPEEYAHGFSSDSSDVVHHHDVIERS